MLSHPTPTNSNEKILAEIKKIRGQIGARLDVQQKLDNAINAGHWNDAYEIAIQEGINIYDPFATFREARQAVEDAGKSVRDVKSARENLRLEVENFKSELKNFILEENKTRAYQDMWEQLWDWNASLVSLTPDLWSGDYARDFLAVAQKASSLGVTLNVEQTEWANRLKQETEYLREKLASEWKMLQDVKNTLNNGDALTGDQFSWLYETHQKPDINSRSINRLYAKAEERYLNRPDTSDIGHKYRQAVEKIENDFKKSDRTAFKEKIIALETDLSDAKNHILRKVYQADLYPWKQRLFAWERASELLKEIQIFEEKVSVGDPKSRAKAWSDEKNIVLFGAALLDLRSLPPEIFALQADRASDSLGQVLQTTFENIVGGLDIPNNAFAPKKWGQQPSGIENLRLDEAAQKEWREYFDGMKTWLKRQMAIGTVFIDELALVSASRPDSGSGARELTPKPSSS